MVCIIVNRALLLFENLNFNNVKYSKNISDYDSLHQRAYTRRSSFKLVKMFHTNFESPFQRFEADFTKYSFIVLVHKILALFIHGFSLGDTR